MKKQIVLVISMVLTLAMIAGCGQEVTKNTEATASDQTNQDEQIEKDEVAPTADQDDKGTEEVSETVTFTDGLGIEREITKNPQRVVIDYNSILGLWYAMGGTSLTKAKGSANVPEEAADLIDLGSHAEMNLEAILALEPDLVILAANVPAQVELDEILKESGIETMVIDVVSHSYEQVLNNARLFASINEREDLYESVIVPMQEDIDKLVAQTATVEEQPKVAAIFATSKSMYLESDSAVTGEIIAKLGAMNILNESEVPIEGESRVPFSIETIATANPDIIFISTMGSEEGVKDYVQSVIDENPIWNTIHAVKNNAVYYLPKEYSIYKPNEAYDEAFFYIAELLYPDETFR